MDTLKHIAPNADTPNESEAPTLHRRRFIAASAAAGVSSFFGPWTHNRVWAQSAQAKPLVIGLTMDASGQYAASGGMERLGAMMAIKEFNEKGGVLGRPIEAIHMDTETTPATGSRVAERMINRNEAAFMIGAVHSGVANAISQVAQKYGCIFLNTNSSSPTESGKDCHRVKFVWDGNGTNFAQATVRNAIQANGKEWVLLTNDYVWGHNTAKSTRSLVEANGGRVVEELLIPQNTRDFSSYLLKLQQLKPQVVATAVGGDDIKALRQQVVQLGLQNRAAWINNQQDWPDVYGLGPESIFGVFGTTWYYRLDLPGVKEFVAAYQKNFPGMAIAVPGNVFYNGYMATRELLRCVQEAGTTNNLAVIKKLEGRKMPARDRMQHFDAWIDPATHQVQQTIYLASYNDAPAEKTDIFKVLTQSDPKDVTDPGAAVACKLESYEATPSYER
ncbi:branched-chain amino acid transport system substrate-binding protein [Hydrogenophaga palleronii]|uniref:Branched-chain amino acid transport system substrate-binding protein n=1 Tax=Hydrogenophaga palleronii TaxID=65655 RepID=A0ABU1WNQ8_9BURK|nr:ABC transporter substrate-binding protein [Hydrogenophaga palleronii]MDR7150684.1 branched-chain amino acid transport system substrate-binding protein [Hydrogenophaga palleronii]